MENKYFPCDSRNAVLTETEAAEIQTMLHDITTLKQKYASKFDTSMILGDLNYDDLRLTGRLPGWHALLREG